MDGRLFIVVLYGYEIFIVIQIHTTVQGSSLASNPPAGQKLNMGHHTSSCLHPPFILLLLTLLAPAVQSCKCIPSTLQQAVCNSELSVHGKVVADYDNCAGRCNETVFTNSAPDFLPRTTYIVRVLASFRGSYVQGDVLYLSVLLFNSCSTAFLIDREYLFNIDTDFVNTDNASCPIQTFPQNLCSDTYDWDSIANKTKTFLNQIKAGNQSICADV